MIPIKDTVRARSFPIVNWLIIIANFLVFFYELSLSHPALRHFVATYGMVPARLWHDPAAAWPTIFTSMFIHGGWFHILSNMWVLYIFGDNVEDRMGSGKYLIFYLLSGMAAALLQAYVLPNSHIPTVGASGAIAGVLGAYLVFFPNSRVITLVFFFVFVTFVEIPSVLFLGFWFFTQLYSGWLALLSPAAMGGVAWWAHVGGFVFGMLFAKPFEGRHYRRPFPDEFFPW